MEFKRGDLVRVVRQVYDEDGWENAWEESMDKMVNNGEIYSVVRVSDTGVWLPDESGLCFGFPPSSLELVEGKWIESEKHDAGKPDFTLLPWSAVTEIVNVLDFGAKKYAPNQWQHVPDAKRRYLAAAFRHLAAYADGEKLDAESGLSHLAHAGCCILFLIWGDK